MIDPDDNSDRAPIVKVGSQLRIRLPKDYGVVEMVFPSDHVAFVGETVRHEGREEQLTLEAISRFATAAMAERVALDVMYGDMLFAGDCRCSVPGCEAMRCYILDSDRCFPHTPGSAFWKQRRIEWRRAKQFWRYELPDRLRGAWLVLRGEAQAREDDDYYD